MQAAIGILIGDGERRPEFDVWASVIRHNSYHSYALAIDRNRLPDDLKVAAKAPTPEPFR
jgi:hypothetical protein